jgi:predicted phosphodiesterase
MRVFALSDIHVDYAENLDWVLQLSAAEYTEDILVLAGDVSHSIELLSQVFDSLKSKFLEVLFVPGNHELWVQGQAFDCSLQKFDAIDDLCKTLGVRNTLFEHESVNFVPLLSWYDFSFGEPDRYLRRAWRNFRACSWPDTLDSSAAVCKHFLQRNLPLPPANGKIVISYSHFLQRIDVMPDRIPADRRRVYPVLGSDGLGDQVRKLQPNIHIYGHSHINQAIELDGINFVNNAFATPSEKRISRKRLHCVADLAESN